MRKGLEKTSTQKPHIGYLKCSWKLEKKWEKAYLDDYVWTLVLGVFKTKKNEHLTRVVLYTHVAPLVHKACNSHGMYSRNI